MGATVWKGVVYISKDLNDRLTEGERRVVFAHEIWHERNGDRLRKCLALITFPAVIGWLISLESYIPALGLACWFKPVMDAYSRHLEMEADRYSIEQTQDTDAFVSLLDKLDRNGPAYPSKEASVNLARHYEFN